MRLANRSHRARLGFSQPVLGFHWWGRRWEIKVTPLVRKVRCSLSPVGSNGHWLVKFIDLISLISLALHQIVLAWVTFASGRAPQQQFTNG